MEHDEEKFSLLKTFLDAAGIEVVKVELPKFEVDGVEKTIKSYRVEFDFLQEVWNELKKHQVKKLYVMAIYMIEAVEYNTGLKKTREVLMYTW